MRRSALFRTPSVTTRSRHFRGRQSNGRKDTPAGPRRDAGFRRQRQLPRPQRARNVQVRINGIMLPDGVTGFGTFLDTALIGNISLITGALPAQFGLRTSGVLDIQTVTMPSTAGLWASMAARDKPSRRASSMAARSVRPSISSRPVLREQYRARKSDAELGGDPRPHDAGAWLCLRLDHSRSLLAFHADGRRLLRRVSIPNTPGLTPNFTAFGISNFNSALLNENQFEQSYSTVAAWQRSINGADVQLSYFNRYSRVHFIPDPIGDIIFNGVGRGLSLRSCQWRNRRHRLSAQRGAHAARRPALAH